MERLFPGGAPSADQLVYVIEEAVYMTKTLAAG